MSNVQNILKIIKEKEIQFVDLRFTDPRGKMQHVSQHVSTIDEDSLAEGFMFDGSSIAGWKAINESDMKLMPDCSRSVVDPFYSQPTLAIFCDVLDPISGQPYERDPRSTAKQALKYMESMGIGDTAYFGPEPEFFVFDDVRYEAEMNSSFYKIDRYEFRHIKTTQEKDYTFEFSGHYHPKCLLKYNGSSYNYKCFILGENFCILPSFGTYTGGLNVESEVLKPVLKNKKIDLIVIGKRNILKKKLKNDST